MEENPNEPGCLWEYRVIFYFYVAFDGEQLNDLK